jgi:hypothetical protein
MATSYTSLLGLALPVTGELSGTWGDTVNNSITSLLDTSIAGTTTLSSDADVTLTTTTGAANTSRQAIILWTAGGTVTRNITAPAQSKIYTVINKTSSTQSIVLRGAGPTTGVTIVKGESAVCAWNGSDFIKISNTSGAGVFTTVTASSLTSGRVTYATTAGLLTDSANLLYSGTDLTVYGLTVGRGAGAVSTNTAVGASALAANTTGDINTAVGSSALAANTTGRQLVAFGKSALAKNTTANLNAAFGENALGENTTGAQNAAFSSRALTENTTGSNNIAMGNASLNANTTGSQNSALGVGALQFNTTASYNTAVGYQSLYGNTTGEQNVSSGYRTMLGNTTGGNNTAYGARALESNTSASNNVAIGRASLFSNTTGTSNTAVGTDALNANTTGTGNTMVGYQTGSALTTANYNTFIGQQAGVLVTTGARNTIIGTFNGNQNSLDIRTSDNHIVLSDGSGNPRGWFDSSGSGYFSGATVAYPGSGNTNTGIFLESSGQLSVSRDNTVVGRFNRNTSDGTLISFARQGTEIGTISVSGGVVSYNAFAGSHWSQLSDGSKPDILRGTVLDSINELVQWPDEPTTERLCKVKVSDTAGSKKVYGVFMDWDNDWTATNDMYVTAVGAFICRVNASVTVQEGDLLESNGDGTARVQADDIIRSSTIGKVTCTEKTHQYDDGSYCVPTVLYCG